MHLSCNQCLDGMIEGGQTYLYPPILYPPVVFILPVRMTPLLSPASISPKSCLSLILPGCSYFSLSIAYFLYLFFSFFLSFFFALFFSCVVFFLVSCFFFTECSNWVIFGCMNVHKNECEIFYIYFLCQNLMYNLNTGTFIELFCCYRFLYSMAAFRQIIPRACGLKNTFIFFNISCLNADILWQHTYPTMIG